jgi:hypothetical protein
MIIPHRDTLTCKLSQLTPIQNMRNQKDYALSSLSKLSFFSEERLEVIPRKRVGRYPLRRRCLRFTPNKFSTRWRRQRLIKASQSSSRCRLSSRCRRPFQALSQHVKVCRVHSVGRHIRSFGRGIAVWAMTRGTFGEIGCARGIAKGDLFGAGVVDDDGGFVTPIVVSVSCVELWGPTKRFLWSVLVRRGLETWLLRKQRLRPWRC